ncbi:MAG TPA: hypothetical protein VGR35_00680 [Tepidisphaeraceae bacterium]|nr:hypothetical protein [Tepidisphaeraceae bacterium]
MKRHALGYAPPDPMAPELAAGKWSIVLAIAGSALVALLMGGKVGSISYLPAQSVSGFAGAAYVTGMSLAIWSLRRGTSAVALVGLSLSGLGAAGFFLCLCLLFGWFGLGIGF